MFELDLTLLELRFLAAIVFDLLLELGIARLAFGFLDRERIALAGQHCQAFESLARFLGEARLERFSICEAFGHGGQFLAAGGEFSLLRENIFAQHGETFRGRGGFLLGGGARDKGLFAQEASF